MGYCTVKNAHNPNLNRFFTNPAVWRSDGRMDRR